MAEIKIKDIMDKKLWEKFVLSHNPNSFLQSWNWGQTHESIGDKVYRKGFYSENRLVGVMQLIKQDAKRGPHLLLPGGPIINYENNAILNAFIKEIKNLAKREGCWFVRVRPELLANDANLKLFKELGFINSPMHLNAENTQVLRIDKSDEELLYDMRKNTRYSVRKSLEQGLKLEISTNPEKVSILYELQKHTADLHGFVGFSKNFFYQQINNFAKNQQAELFLIKDKRDKVHVAAIIIFYGDAAYYHHSASSFESRDNYASYFLQWNVMQEARKRGLTKYNLWGVSPDMKNKQHRFYGVTVFKKGFGGEQVDWLPAHDYPILPTYWLTYGFESIRKLHRRL